MAYNQNIPQPNDNLSISQGDLLANFQQLDTAFAIDHTAFSVNTNVGQHKKITFPTTTTTGAQSLLASILYPKTGIGSQLNAGVPFLRNKNGDYPLMPNLITSGTDYGFSFGELTFNFGLSLIAQGNVDATVTYAIPFTAGALSLQVSKETGGTGSSGANAAIAIAATNLTTATVHSYSALPSGNLSFYYFVVGI